MHIPTHPCVTAPPSSVCGDRDSRDVDALEADVTSRSALRALSG